jgi:hypothetical protein
MRSMKRLVERRVSCEHSDSDAQIRPHRHEIFTNEKIKRGKTLGPFIPQF